jgi:hypothetical protein
MKKQYPSQARLRELFDYDPEGFLVWKNQNLFNAYSGQKAGYFGFSKGLSYFNKVSIGKRKFDTFDLIWIWNHGDIPEDKKVCMKVTSFFIKLENLQLVDYEERRSFTAPKGSVRKSGLTYSASFENKYIGTFNTEYDAFCAIEDFILAGSKSTEFILKNRTSRKKPKTKSLRIKGAYFDSRKRIKPWRSKFQKIHLGYYETQEQAARAYNIAAYEHYGEHAVLNDIPDPLGVGF